MRTTPTPMTDLEADEQRKRQNEREHRKQLDYARAADLGVSGFVNLGKNDSDHQPPEETSGSSLVMSSPNLALHEYGLYCAVEDYKNPLGRYENANPSDKRSFKTFQHAAFINYDQHGAYLTKSPDAKNFDREVNKLISFTILAKSDSPASASEVGKPNIHITYFNRNDPHRPGGVFNIRELRRTLDLIEARGLTASLGPNELLYLAETYPAHVKDVQNQLKRMEGKHKANEVTFKLYDQMLKKELLSTEFPTVLDKAAALTAKVYNGLTTPGEKLDAVKREWDALEGRLSQLQAAKNELTMHVNAVQDMLDVSKKPQVDLEGIKQVKSSTAQAARAALLLSLDEAISDIQSRKATWEQEVTSLETALALPAAGRTPDQERQFQTINGLKQRFPNFQTALTDIGRDLPNLKTANDDLPQKITTAEARPEWRRLAR